MLHTPLAQISTLLAAVTVTWALVGGRWPERVAAIAIALDWMGCVLLQDHAAGHHPQSAIFALDAAQAVVLLALALVCRRSWVLWAAALGLLLVLTHVAMLLDPNFDQWSYLTAAYVWSFGLLLSLGLGVRLEGRAAAPPPPRLARLMGPRPSTPSATARNRS